MTEQYDYLVVRDGICPSMKNIEIHKASHVGIYFPSALTDLPEGTHVHGSYEFCLPVSELPESRLGKARIKMMRNHLYPYNSEQEHGMWMPIEDVSLAAIQIDKGFLQGIAEQYCGKNEVRFENENFTVSRGTLTLIQMFVDESNKQQTGFELILDSLSAQLVVDLLRKVKSNVSMTESQPSGKYKENIQQAITFLMDNFNGDLSLKDIAGEANLSPYHFIRVFKEETGRTPYEYLISIRIQRACELLQRSNQTVAEIGTLCGFSNPSHFSTVFTRIKGCTPSSYRKHLY